MLKLLKAKLRPEPIPPNPPQFVSWHRKLGETIEYLVWNETCWGLTDKLSKAYRFNTIEEAKTATPYCDKAAFVGKRSGILAVRGNRA